MRPVAGSLWFASLSQVALGAGMRKLNEEDLLYDCGSTPGTPKSLFHKGPILVVVRIP